jgi:hypothetical protein
VLAVIKSRGFEHALEIANDTEFGLTGAVYTKSRDKIEAAIQEFHVGNLYINRKCTGAMVGAHPFGGFNMSGTDSKAGGPDYLYLFTQAKAVGERSLADGMSAITIASIGVCALGICVMRPGSHAESSSRLAARAPENLNSLLEPLLKKYDLPALAAAIVTSKGLSAVGAVGVRKYGTDTPVTINDQFHLGSDTKAMTATMLATLVEEGKLSWGTRLEQVFPDLTAKMDPAYRKVTLEQLLAHRAGFTDESWPQGKTFKDMHKMPGTPREQRAVYVAMVLSERPVNQPGSAYLYSNRSYAVAGAIAEKVANDSWEHLMQKRSSSRLACRAAALARWALRAQRIPRRSISPGSTNCC